MVIHVCVFTVEILWVKTYAHVITGSVTIEILYDVGLLLSRCGLHTLEKSLNFRLE